MQKISATKLDKYFHFAKWSLQNTQNFSLSNCYFSESPSFLLIGFDEFAL